MNNPSVEFSRLIRAIGFRHYKVVYKLIRQEDCTEFVKWYLNTYKAFLVPQLYRTYSLNMSFEVHMDALVNTIFEEYLNEI